MIDVLDIGPFRIEFRPHPLNRKVAMIVYITRAQSSLGNLASYEEIRSDGGLIGRIRAFKRMAKAFALMSPVHYDTPFERASGQCVCETCGLPYIDHPETAVPGLTKTCDGRVWHL